MTNKQDKTDIYDVSKYTDIELYNILDLNQPTDRELEAKIHFFINKYEKMQSTDGRKLYQFFNDIYAHLFDLPEEDQEYDHQEYDHQEYDQEEYDHQDQSNNLQEGFDIKLTGFDSSNQTMFEPSGSLKTPFDKPTTAKPGTQPQSTTKLNELAKIDPPDTATVKPIDYIPGNLNPLLKQTIKQIVSVDSQYRDQSTYPLTTFFTFNLSETLCDVVSLKLYSVQIPYTWYTIDKNFGSNFFYLKGISPGIDDGNSDYRFDINPGNYTAPELITQINNSILNVYTSNNVVDLSNTTIKYTPGDAKCTFKINVVQRYNDINYELYFPTWTNPGDNNEYIQNSTQIRNTESRFNSIPGFLGLLNNSSIQPSSIYSTYTIYSHPMESTTTSNSQIDSNNNNFNIILYKDMNGLVDGQPTKYTSSINNNTIQVTMSNNGAQLSDNISTILQYINDGFDQIPQLTGSTITKETYTITTVDASYIPSDKTYNRFKINIKLNKQNTKYYDGMKAIIQFPDDTRLWLGYGSLFYFDSSINELNNIISEIDTPTTSYIVNNNPYIYLKCNKEYYGTTKINSYIIDNIMPDICGNPIDSTNPNIFHNTDSTKTTYTIRPNNQNNYYIGPHGNCTIYGDEKTIINKTVNVTTGDINVSGNNYTIYSPDAYTILGNAKINGNITTSTTSITSNTSNNLYIISGEDYVISGNTQIGNVYIAGNMGVLKGNIIIKNIGPLTVDGDNYDILGNTNISGNVTIINGNCQILSNSQTIISGNDYYISGNSFITGSTYSGNVTIIDGNVIVGNSGSYTIYGNQLNQRNSFAISGATSIVGSITVNGNVHITNLTGSATTIFDLNTSTHIFNSSTSSYDLINSKYKITTSTSYTIQGQDTINEQPNSIYIIGNATIQQGNSTIYSPVNSYNIISGQNYKIDTSIDGNIHITGNTSITNANIQIYSANSYNINSANCVLIGNTYSVTGPTSIIGNAKMNSISSYNIIGQDYYIDGNANVTGPITIFGGNVNIATTDQSCTISGNNYSVIGSASISGNVLINSGNLSVSSVSPYIVKGNNYIVEPSINCTISGNSYIVNGNSYIYGNNYSVYGNISAYQDISDNDFRIDISNNISGYLLPDYLSAINTSMRNVVTNKLLPSSSITIDTNNPSLHSSLKFKFEKAVDPHYTIDLTECYLGTDMGIDEPIDISQTSTTVTNNSNFTQQGGGHLITKFNNEIIITPSNSIVPPIIISIEPATYLTIDALCNAINKAFAENSITNKTNITYTINQNNTVLITLYIIISNTLTTSDYTAYFYDNNLLAHRDISNIDVPGFYGYVNNWTTDGSIQNSSINTWYNYLNIPNQNYNLSMNQVNTINSEIIGTGAILSNNITLVDGSTNSFWIKPKYDPLGGVYTTTKNATSTGGYNDILITVPAGTYSKEQLAQYINTAFSENPITNGSSISFISKNNLQYTSIRLNILKNFTTQDYVLDFYDPESYTTCKVGMFGQSSIQNVLWDSTLGWILGFRNTTLYYLTNANQQYNTTNSSYYYGQFPQTAYTYNTTSNTATITGDTCVSVYLYNYFMIILDDYVQNHLNDGLVTITNTDTSIPLPSYANRATYRCDPITKKPMVISTPTNSNNLTAKQLYAANEILNVQQTEQSKYSAGPFIQDIFGLVPIKTSGMQNGQPYIEFGGSLQLQERTYFGPVNIRRMTIKLINDKGNVVDLNGANWSFSLICERLYTSQNK